MSTPVSRSLLRSAGVVLDPTATGVERYTHKSTGRACVRQAYMSASRYAAELTRFCEAMRARGRAETRSKRGAMARTPPRPPGAAMTGKQYAALVRIATEEAEGSSLRVAERLVYRFAYRHVRGPFRRGERRASARDMALQAICDVAMQTGRLEEFE